MRITYILFGISLFIFSSCNQDENRPVEDPNWSYYLGDQKSSQFKYFDEINTSNAGALKVAWTYSSGGVDTSDRSQVQTNPLVVDGVVYGASPQLHLFAVDAVTGKELWTFDPNREEFKGNFLGGLVRGLVYTNEGGHPRILYSPGHYLYSIDAKTGKTVDSFGDGGRINLKKGYDRNMDEYYMTANTPGVVYKDLYILGNRVSESTGAFPGHLRAFDINTGEIKWTFHTIPQPGEFGYDTWPKDAFKTSGGANTWAGLSLDQDRGIVYVPTGSASFDYYGGDRSGSNLFANCIIALDALTGERKWHYQTIHHDIWDRDLPAPPNLMTLNIDGEQIDVIAQISKSGFLFVLDRETGEPIYPIEEIEVPPSNLPGEEAWPTQPVPTVYPAFSQTEMTEENLAIRSPIAAQFAKGVWETSNKGAQFIPLDEKLQIFFPGLDGGGEWGGAAHGKDNNVLYVNSNEQAWMLGMVPVKPSPPGEKIFSSRCASCHNMDLSGNQLFGNVPSLVGLKDRLPKEVIEMTIRQGRGVMPAFSLNQNQLDDVIAFIQGEEDPNNIQEVDSSWPYPFTFAGFNKAYAPDGYSVFQPPWGQLTAIDMDEAEILWQVPLGNVDSLDIPGHPVTGTENYGGPVVTSGDVLFIAATQDEKFRVFNRKTGEILFEHKLPAAGYATPATYMVDGKQYIVVSCGGGKLGTKSGDSYVAFSL